MVRLSNRIFYFMLLAVLSFDCLAKAHHAKSTAAKDFGIFSSGLEESAPAIAYNFRDDVFLVVSVVKDTLQTKHNIYGQFVKPDGSLQGSRFTICVHAADQTCPDVAYGINNEFVVVWCDFRIPNGDVYGARLDASGKKLKNANTLDDTTFVVCDQDSGQYAPRIAHNPVDNNYLVVWTDRRNSYDEPFGKRMGKPSGLFTVNLDVYGQRLDDQGLPIAPLDPPNSKVNFPVAVDNRYDEYYQDVAYCGGGDRPDEWLVVFLRYGLNYQIEEPGLVYGVRIDGKTGYWLDTWGNPVSPNLAKAADAQDTPPWTPHFPIGAADPTNPEYQNVYQGGPHVESNTGWLLHTGQSQALHPYPRSECLVVWSEYPSPSAIKAQRVAYFPDSTALRMNLKPSRGADGMFTLVPVDSLGKPAVPYLSWMTWNSLFITGDEFQHEYANVSYNPVSGDFLVVWNDWRNSGWDGTFPIGGPFIPPPGDIYGQRLYLSPGDSAILFLDQAANPMANPHDNIPVVSTGANEGNWFALGIAYGYSGDRFLVAYEWEQDNDEMGIDVQGTLFSGTPTAVRDSPGRNAPGEFILAGNYPNPFNPGTTIDFRLAIAGRAQVKVLDALGRDVVTLSDGIRQAGRHEVRWDGMDGQENPAASGVYFYKILSGPHATVGKMLLLR
jgi:hypothetical protein